MLRKSISNRSISNRISKQLYKRIIELMPICCVDIVLKDSNKIYLFKRAYEPAKNEWWLIGGRILKDEHLNEAVIRKAKEEIGVDVKILKMIGLYETFFPNSKFDTKKKITSVHSISICFLVELKHKNFKLKLNEEYTAYKKITKIDENLHPYIKTVLRASGVIT